MSNETTNQTYSNMSETYRTEAGVAHVNDVAAALQAKAAELYPREFAPY